ncbi:uncharacterized protein LOC133794317 [Humulus lupulus]|uniref:uncharacterized protein LOC133794317 n=1 Tax=Humulus lupulus TaxID=3486 RepID=UPI002B40A97A|nr:uncharacterized protein LOC133794317 [Humulus lupulus]
MEVRSALLANLTDVEKSIKHLVTEAVSSSISNVATSSCSTDMSSKDVFEHYKAAAASSGRKEDSKRTRGESSKTAPKKARTEDPPATVPSKDNTPPPSPLEQPGSTPPVDQDATPPTIVDQHPTPQDPTSRTHRTQPSQPECSLSSSVVSSTRERIYKLSKHKRSQEAIDDTISMEIDQILN